MTKDKATILIIDDSPVNIQLLSEFLDDYYHVFFATNGEKGLELARNKKPDLILLDIMMPVMDGYQVCMELKASEATHHIPVIFITAMSSIEAEARGFKLGASDYITKPFNPDLVLLRVRNHLELKNQRDVLEQRTIKLEKALAEIKVLQGIIPICAQCKKIRNDQGYWQQLEVFIRDHSEAEFSHSICPGCMKELYPQQYVKIYPDK